MINFKFKNHIKNKTIFLFVSILLIYTVSGCSLFENQEKKDIEGDWIYSGLEHREITRMKFDTGDFLITSDSGIYKKVGQEYLELGLSNFKSNDIAKLDSEMFMVAIPSPNPQGFSRGDKTLYRTLNNGVTWEVFMGNYGGEDEDGYIEKLSIDRKNRSNIFARSSGLNVSLTVDGGQTWSVKNGSWGSIGGIVGFMYIDSYFNNRLWAGGVNGVSQPYILKSEDYGENWDFLEAISAPEGGGGVAWDLVTNPEKKEEALVGMSGIIKKTTDGGESWRIVYQGVGVYALEVSPRDQQRIYAAGVNQSGTLFFSVTEDFGDSWETVEFKEGPIDIYVNDLVALLEEGKEILYFGTTKGVYAYTFEN